MTVSKLPAVQRDARGQLVRELEGGKRVVLTPSEVAVILDVDPRTVRRACATGDLPSFKLGQKTFIPAAPLLDLLHKGAA